MSEPTDRSTLDEAPHGGGSVLARSLVRVARLLVWPTVRVGTAEAKPPRDGRTNPYATLHGIVMRSGRLEQIEALAVAMPEAWERTVVGVTSDVPEEDAVRALFAPGVELLGLRVADPPINWLAGWARSRSGETRRGDTLHEWARAMDVTLMPGAS